MSVHNRLTKLTAKSPKVTPEPTPAPELDPETQKTVDRLLAQFSGKTTGEPTAPAPSVESQTELSKTTSLDPQRFEDLKNQKAAEERATTAERRVENLEKTLAHVTDHLSAFVM